MPHSTSPAAAGGFGGMPPVPPPVHNMPEVVDLRELEKIKRNKYDDKLKRQTVEMVRTRCLADPTLKKTQVRRNVISLMKDRHPGFEKLTPQMLAKWERALDKVFFISILIIIKFLCFGGGKKEKKKKKRKKRKRKKKRKKRKKQAF